MQVVIYVPYLSIHVPAPSQNVYAFTWIFHLLIYQININS